MLLGMILDKTNPETVVKIQEARAKFEAMGLSNEQISDKVNELKLSGVIPVWDYSTAWLVFIGCALLSLIFAFLLKAEDRKKQYGLELPNIQK